MIEHLLFYLFSFVFLVAGLMVILARNSVHAALFLVTSFFASAALWILLEAEFLALILILVYVGAVMTLFLFVIMMLNLDISPKQEGFVRYLPVSLIVITLIGATLIYVIAPQHFGLQHAPMPAHQPASYSNVSELGEVLYTRFVYPFELAAVLLLTAIIAAISLSLRKPRGKVQEVPEQLQIDREDRVRLVKMDVVKNSKDKK